jgi:hypothetical protein
MITNMSFSMVIFGDDITGLSNQDVGMVAVDVWVLSIILPQKLVTKQFILTH